MSSASDTTLRRKQRVLFADRIVQETTFNNGWKNRIVLEGGNFGGAMTYPPYYNMINGELETTPEERQSYIDSVPNITSIVVTTVPGSPTNVSVVAGNTQATISFTAPSSDGGSPILSYTVTSVPDGIIAIGSESPITVTGLTNGTSYTFTVVATNAVGDSLASEASNSVTPNIVLIRTLFTSGTGTWTAPSGVTSVDYLLVGGGGGGGAGAGTGSGGGGGAGSVKTGTTAVTPGSSYSYTVGAGGSGGAGSNILSENGVVGGNTVFDVVTANGGGLGYRNGQTNSSGLYGSGGLVQSEDTPTTGGSGGNIRDGGSNPNNGAAGGGGGAGGAGVTTTSNGTDNNRGGAGGSGIISDLKDGTNQTYGVGGKGADEGTSSFIGILQGANGTANTGNGGGGGASHFLGNNGASGGSGGSGIIVLNYYI